MKKRRSNHSAASSSYHSSSSSHSSYNNWDNEDGAAFRADHMRRCAQELREIQRARPNPYEPSGESEDQRIIREHYEKREIDRILSELGQYDHYDY